MGLFKRNKLLWMDFMYQGERIRRSTGTSDKRQAEAILGKIKSQIVESKFFDKLEEQERTFGEMMERYVAERSILKAPKSLVRDGSALKHLLPIFGEKCLAEITPKSLAAYKTQRRADGAATATINKELQLVRHAFNLAMREWEWCRKPTRSAPPGTAPAKSWAWGCSGYRRRLRYCFQGSHRRPGSTR